MGLGHGTRDPSALSTWLFGGVRSLRSFAPRHCHRRRSSVQRYSHSAPVRAIQARPKDLETRQGAPFVISVSADLMNDGKRKKPAEARTAVS
eukprot:scaffold870_cov268-Pinguiococcus_pyrenoidosus.AAC.92